MIGSTGMAGIKNCDRIEEPESGLTMCVKYKGKIATNGGVEDGNESSAIG